MRLVLDEPTPIDKLRKVYNDKVTFITTVKSYPLVSEIQFSGDYYSALNKRRVPVRIGRKIDRAIEDYQSKLIQIWESNQKDILDVINFDDKTTLEETEKSILEGSIEKAKRITLAQVNQERNSVRRFILRSRFIKQEKDRLIKPRVERLKKELQKEAKKHFERVFKIGKERAQVLTDQQLDDALNFRDRRELKAKYIWNEEFVAGLTDDLYAEYAVVLGQTFDNPKDLADAIERVDKRQKRRLPLFAAAVGSVLLAAGTTAAARAVRENPKTGKISPDPIPDPEDGMPIGRAFDGGLWRTRHDKRVCPGCEENDGKWMTHDQFQAEAGTNQCLTRCRCVELFEFEEKPTSAGKIWSGTPGASIKNWPRFKRRG